MNVPNIFYVCRQLGISDCVYYSQGKMVRWMQTLYIYFRYASELIGALFQIIFNGRMAYYFKGRVIQV